ncbi:hypothetical protein J132_08528 [Termitomyces sp. J132]|nr:hypothetical protein C0989_000056 [Termitomyces sp. Mn162]KNZ79870.1 hypothetical protein J132_08528 [Termitomyces sp. J132]
MTQNKRREKHQAVHAAKKKVMKKGHEQVPVRSSHPYVFVGNLRSNITALKLRELFAPCGEILDIIIRCSFGSIVATEDDSSDLWYASVTFTGLSAAKQALSLTGTELDGRKIVVTKLPGELPEVLRKTQMRLGLPHQSRRVPNRLAAEPTVLINPNDRHNVFGVSFAKCII